MTTLTDFRRMVTADDRDGWLIFADWLDDQGDERAACVRRFAEDELVDVDGNVSRVIIVPLASGRWFIGACVYEVLKISRTDFDWWQDFPTPLDAILSLAEACLAAEKDQVTP